MINVIHANGTSFKGLWAYLSHDKDADTSERVAWMHTHNLATEDAEAGYKVMIATAQMQDEIKQNAGVPATGRKSKNVVMHYTLSWHEEEREELGRDEMLQAALASMQYLGTNEGDYLGKNRKSGKEIRATRTQFADEHQAVIICHRDEEHPHVHVMLNRVHPEHGRMLPDSKDYEKLSAWALEYRRAQGREHYCPQRVRNAAKRAQGLRTSNRRQSRQQYELRQEWQQAQEHERKRQLEQIRQKTAELTAAKAKTRERHAARVHALEETLLHDEGRRRDETAQAIRAERARVKGEFRPRIEQLHDRQEAERAAFEDARESLKGHARNTWEVFKTKEWMRELRTSPLGAMKQAFQLAFSAGLQRQQLDAHHTQEQERLRRQRLQEEQAAARGARQQMQSRLVEQRRQFDIERNELVLQQDMDKAKQKAEWAELEKQRHEARIRDDRARIAALHQQERERQEARARGTPPPPPSARSAFNQAAPPTDETARSGDDAGDARSPAQDDDFEAFRRRYGISPDNDTRDNDHTHDRDR